MLRIAFSTLSARKGGMSGAFAAVSLAVVLVVSCGILLDSSLRARIPAERLAAAAVVVQAEPTLSGSGNVSASLSERRRLPVSIARQLEVVPGVSKAVADRSFPAEIVNQRGRLLSGPGGTPSVGHGWESSSLTPFTLVDGRAPRTPDEVVLARGLAQPNAVRLGDRLRILTAHERQNVTVVGIADAPAGHRLSRESPVFFRDDAAARLSHTGDRADLIAVLLSRGADQSAVAKSVRGVLSQPGLRVLTGASRGEAESPEDALSREDSVAGLTVFALLAAFVAIFVVAGTFALSVQQRHREFALFRAIGSTPRQVRRMVAGEAMLIALAAVVIAAPISVLAAHVERGLFTRAGLLPGGLDVVIGWLPFAAGLVAAVIATQLAAFASARRASRIRPIDALRETTIRRRPVSLARGLVGLAALAGGIAVLTASGSGRESSAPAAAMVWMLAVALLGPLLAWPFAWLIGLPLAAISRGPGLLARANTRANLRRVASVATPMMLAVSLVCSIFFGKTALEGQTAKQTAQRTTAGYVLRARGAEGLPANTAATARQAPGVVQASGSFATSVVVAADGVNLRSFPARAVDGATLAGVIDLGVVSGSLTDLHGSALAVSSEDAKTFGWRSGDRVKVWLGDGAPVTLRVAATYTRPLGFADIVLPRTLAERHVTRALDDAVFVKAGPGAGARLNLLARENPALEVTTRAQYESQLADAAHKQSLEVYVLLGLIVAFCALSAVNAVMMSTAERAREFALLRLVGAGKRQVEAMIRAETLITIAFGLAIGTCIAIPGLAILSQDLTGSVMPAGPLWVYGALLALFALLAFAASGISTRLALRMNPVKAMAARE